MTARSAFRTLVTFLFVPVTLAAQTGYVTMSDSARLYYRIIGHAADTIIAIHGGPGMDHESIFGDFKVLGDHHTVIFYDQRGGGKSTLPTDTTTLVAKRQIQDLDELRSYWGETLGIDGSVITVLRKSNSGMLKGRIWRSEYGVLTVRASDT